MEIAKARILVSNDDGIHSPGLKILERMARSLSRDVWVVAPETEQSAAGHSLTLTVPLRVRKVSARRFAVGGTPTDSVLLGVNEIVKGRKPDLVLSGINAGGNLGEDITYSGTVAAAMEATLLHIPAIALSQVRKNGVPVRWSTAAHYGVDVIQRLVAEGWPGNVLMNVNFPDVPHDHVQGIEATRQGRRKIGGRLNNGIDPRGHPYIWIGTERDEDPSFSGSDLEAVHANQISITPLCLDFTHRPTLTALKKALR
jgi:5'-nucleotidase